MSRHLLCWQKYCVCKGVCTYFTCYKILQNQCEAKVIKKSYDEWQYKTERSIWTFEDTTTSWAFLSILHFVELVANSYEFVQSLFVCFMQSACAWVTLMFRCALHSYFKKNCSRIINNHTKSLLLPWAGKYNLLLITNDLYIYTHYIANLNCLSVIWSENVHYIKSLCIY